ncbi:MAG: toll/interleukin-1 receptor domain-containing protein [Longimicrobiaceae bacterium]
MDVFISYSSRDKEWVRGELLTRIEQAGVKAFIDFRDFTRGAPSIAECERGVVECRKTLLILTPKYFESEWGKIENVMAQTLSPANHDLRIIPLLKEKCDKPLRIAALTYIDFTDDADQDLAWHQLLTALGAPPESEPPQEPRRDQWFLAHPYPMPPNFTGRLAERVMLTRWLAEDTEHPLLSIRALGGFGKSALVWHWLTHDVDPASWPRVVWWSFYEGDASFDDFLSETLDYLSGGMVAAARISGRDTVERLLEKLREPGTLLVLDGFERVLRAFSGLNAAYQGDEAEHEGSDRDCISPLATLFLYKLALIPRLESKVLLTTRLCPSILEARGGGLLTGAREVPLEQIQPVDAVAFFRAQGIRGTRTEVEMACAPYGYHPLSLRLLAGLIVNDLQQPGDIAAAKRLDVSGDLVQRQHHVLEFAFDSLTPVRQALLSRIACFRSPVTYDTLRALAETEANPVSQVRSFFLQLVAQASDLDADLRDLVARGLLHLERREGRFDLHPIVRRYAYDRLAVPDRAVAHLQLRNYFAAVPPTERVTRLEDLAPVIELYHHTVRAGQLNEAFTLYRNRLDPLYHQLGAYVLIIDLMRALFPDGEGHPPHLRNKRDQSWTLNELANCYSRSGQPRRAIPLFLQAYSIDEAKGGENDLAIGLGNMALCEAKIGALRVAEANFRRRIEILQKISIEDAIGHLELGRLLAYRGAYPECETELMSALTMFDRRHRRYALQIQSLVEAYRALQILLHLRLAACNGSLIPETSTLKFALTSTRRAMELTDEAARFGYPLERNYVQAHWLLGATYRVAGREDEAERYLLEALKRCQRINLVEFEADILIDLVRLRAVTDAAEEAQRLADEAGAIAERCGYVLQGADVHLELARLALSRSDQSAAREHAEKARRLATCDGPPDYTYAAAYAESGALLASLA